MSGIQKISSIILYIIAGISVILVLLYYLGGIVPETVGTTDEYKFTGQFLTWGVILVVITTVITLLFSFANIFTNKGAIKGFVISLVAGLVLLGVSFALAKSNMLEFLPNEIKDETTVGQLKWTGTGLIATYILIVVAIVGMLVSEIVRAFK